MKTEIVKGKIKKALLEFIEKDKKDLYTVDIYEPTLSHRIAVYLEELFSEYYIDCEYNKHLSKNKTISNNKNIISSETGKKRNIRPDIIIHKERGKDTENLVIFEIKKCGKDTKKAKEDIKKLEDCLEKDLNYTIGVFVGILKGRVDIVWIEKDKNKIYESLITK